MTKRLSFAHRPWGNSEWSIVYLKTARWLFHDVMSRSRDVLDEEGLVCVLYVRAEGGPDDVSNCWFYVDSYHPLFVSSITRQSHMLNVRDNAIEANSDFYPSRHRGCFKALWGFRGPRPSPEILMTMPNYRLRNVDQQDQPF